MNVTQEEATLIKRRRRRKKELREALWGMRDGEAEGFARVVDHMYETVCGFLTAIRGEKSGAENIERNRRLLKDIQESDLRYRAWATNGCFCVFNNRFAPQNFIHPMTS